MTTTASTLTRIERAVDPTDRQYTLRVGPPTGGAVTVTGTYTEDLGEARTLADRVVTEYGGTFAAVYPCDREGMPLSCRLPVYHVAPSSGRHRAMTHDTHTAAHQRAAGAAAGPPL